MAYSSAPWAAPRHMAALPQRSWLRWAGDAHSVGLEIDEDRADPLGAVASGEAGPHQAGPGHVPAGDVVLVGVQPEAATAVVDQVGAHEVGGRARVRLGDA